MVLAIFELSHLLFDGDAELALAGLPTSPINALEQGVVLQDFSQNASRVLHLAP